MRWRMLCAGLIAAPLLILSCSVQEETEWYTRGQGGNSASSLAEEVSELFSESVGDDGSLRWHFCTNDTEYIRSGGYAVWDITATQNSTEPVTIRASKQSGVRTEGFGLVYFYRTAQGREYMLLAMINVLQQYTVGKYADGEYTPIIGWTGSPLLRAGYGSANTVGLAYDTSSKRFTLSLNGTVADTFIDSEKPRLTTGRSGMVVCISQFESFPSSCVDVTFSEVQ